MTTALTVYLSNTVSAILSTANQLYTILGTPTSGSHNTNIGTNTGFGEVPSRSASTWLAGGSIGSPTAKGWFLDPTTLDKTAFISGTWTSTVKLGLGSPGTITADVYVRAFRYSGGVYTQIASTVLTGQSITGTNADYTTTGTGTGGIVFAPGDKLYIDVWLNITANAVGNSALTVGIVKLSNDTGGLTGSNEAQVVTTGYLAVSIDSVTETATGSEVVIIAEITTSIVSLTEIATGTETVVAITLPVPFTVTEFAFGTEIVTSQSLSIRASTAQMTAFDLVYWYGQIMESVVGPQLQILATVYYGNTTNSQVIYGELDALFPHEQISQLHAMRTAADVQAFLKAYEYAANVLLDKPIVYYRLDDPTALTTVQDISGRKMIATMSGNVTPGQAGALAQSPDTAMLLTP